MRNKKIQPSLFEREEFPLLFPSETPVETPPPATWIEMRAAVLVRYRNMTAGQAMEKARKEFSDYQNEP